MENSSIRGKGEKAERVANILIAKRQTLYGKLKGIVFGLRLQGVTENCEHSCHLVYQAILYIDEYGFS